MSSAAVIERALAGVVSVDTSAIQIMHEGHPRKEASLAGTAQEAPVPGVEP